MAPFRQATGTEGVDIYALNYMDYCAGHGSAMQLVYDYLVSWGIDPRDENPLLPNAPLLRSAEAVDAVLNAASSGSDGVENEMNAGRILCSSDTNATLTFIEPKASALTRSFVPRACAVVQLGGIIYVTMLLIVALLLIQLLPAINVAAQIAFEGCQLARTQLIATTKAAEVAGDLNLEQEGGDLTDIVNGEGGGGGADLMSAAGIPGTGSSASTTTTTRSLDDEYLSPQQMRSVLRKRRGESGACVSTTVRSVASFGRRALRLGAPPSERDGLLPRHGQSHV